MSRVGVRRQVIPLLAALQLTGLPLAAQSPGLDSIIPARPTDYVSDFAGVVSPEIEAELNSLLARLRAAAGVEIAAVTLPTIGRYEPEQVGLEIQYVTQARIARADIVNRDARILAKRLQRRA